MSTENTIHVSRDCHKKCFHLPRMSSLDWNKTRVFGFSKIITVTLVFPLGQLHYSLFSRALFAVLSRKKLKVKCLLNEKHFLLLLTTSMTFEQCLFFVLIFIQISFTYTLTLLDLHFCGRNLKFNFETIRRSRA